MIRSGSDELGWRETAILLYPNSIRGTVCQMPHVLALMHQAWSGVYAVHGALERADCVVGFAFGRLMGGADVLPGISNQALSAFAYRNCSHLPKILQSEIAAAYARDFPRDSAPTQIVTEHRRKGRYLDTRETAEQAWLMMQAHNWRTALVLAHGHHMPRAVAVCQKLGMSTAALPGLEHIPFCPGSEQFWTRNCWLWFPREVGAILHYWRLGWL